MRSMAAVGLAWVPAISDDATAKHLVLKRADKWHRHATHDEYAYIVREVFAIPPTYA